MMGKMFLLLFHFEEYVVKDTPTKIDADNFLMLF